MPDLTQANRKIAINTPLGDDKLLLQSFQVTERLGRMFQIEATMVSTDANLDFSQVVGKNVTIRAELDADTDRFWNGIVSHFSQSTKGGQLTVYTATIVPLIWLLNRAADFRVFQNMAAPDILRQMFTLRKFDSVVGTYPQGAYSPWEYCVQYRETDFNFISRLMEEEGIYYFFQHENGKHTLELADSAGSHLPFSDKYATITFHPSGGTVQDGEFIFNWDLERAIEPSSYDLGDYDFTQPGKRLLGTASSENTDEVQSFGYFDYPGGFQEASDADHYAQVRLEELQAQREVVVGQSNCRGIAVGYTFKLEGHPRDDQNKEYLVTGTTMHFSSAEFTTDRADDEDEFTCRFTAIDAKTQFRSPRTTPKPVIQGPQTAVVVGPTGKEIYTDEYRRVKVQFFWDMYGKDDENSSCWIRVAHSWAGNNYGGDMVPRIGMEVVVEFLEGDPDCPLIVGCVYNGDNMPQASGASFDTVSLFMSSSSPGGGGSNYLYIDDKKGQEILTVRAEKDMIQRVENDFHMSIGEDYLQHVERDRHVIIDRHHYESIAGDRNLTTTGNDNVETDGDLSLAVGGSRMETCGKDHAQSTTGNHSLSAETISLSAQNNLTLQCGDTYIVLDSTGIKLSGPVSIELDGPTLTINANDTASLNVGQLDVAASQQMSLQGPQIQLSASGAATLKAGGAMTIKGSTVAIN